MTTSRASEAQPLLRRERPSAAARATRASLVAVAIAAVLAAVAVAGVSSRFNNVLASSSLGSLDAALGDAGAPKPGTLQSPPLYVKRTLRGGQTVRHPGSVIVRHISRVPSPDALEARARAARPTSDIPGPLSAFSLYHSSFFPPP